MDLELASGLVIHDVTADDILVFIDGEDFAILSASPEMYIQCCEQREPPHEFELEYREGSQESHFRAVDEPITLDQVIDAFICYLEGDPSWQTAFCWERLEFS